MKISGHLWKCRNIAVSVLSLGVLTNWIATTMLVRSVHAKIKNSTFSEKEDDFDFCLEVWGPLCYISFPKSTLEKKFSPRTPSIEAAMQKQRKHKFEAGAHFCSPSMKRLIRMAEPDGTGSWKTHQNIKSNTAQPRSHNLLSLTNIRLGKSETVNEYLFPMEELQVYLDQVLEKILEPMLCSVVLWGPGKELKKFKSRFKNWTQKKHSNFSQKDR